MTQNAPHSVGRPAESVFKADSYFINKYKQKCLKTQTMAGSDSEIRIEKILRLFLYLKKGNFGISIKFPLKL